jgi:hypothetical protein
LAAPKRNKDQIKRDQAIVAELYLKGWQQVDIADHLTAEFGIEYSVEMIKRDLRLVRERWLKSSLRDFDELRSEQLAKLDLMELQTWEQWARSCADYSKKTTGTGPQGPIDKTETGSQSGDPRYINVLLSIIERRCKLLGLDAPQKVAPTNPEGDQPYNPPSATEAEKRIQELMAKLYDAGSK